MYQQTSLIYLLEFELIRVMKGVLVINYNDIIKIKNSMV